MPNKQYIFNAPPVDGGSNRVNTSRMPPANLKSRGSLRYSNIVAANGSLQVPASGTEFYFRVATGTISARPSGGVYSDYSQGQGMRLTDENAFSMIELKNANAFPVVFELFIGFQGFIDNQLILALDTQKVVAKPTYDTASSAASVSITDISGQAFTDINGNEWYALQREAFYVFNPDAGVTLLVQEESSVVSNGPAIAVVYPLTSLRLPFSGNYRLHLGGANINAIVSEGYLAIPKIVT
jgi:hypothetical protein